MWVMIKQMSLPILLLMAGGGSLYYGAARHKMIVYDKDEKEITVEVPTAFGPPLSTPGQAAHGEGRPTEEESAAANAAAPDGENPFGPNSRPPGNQGAENPFEAAGPGVFGFPGLPPEMMKVKVRESREETEWTLVREVTFGGLQIEDGRLQRTYRGEAPIGCLT